MEAGTAVPRASLVGPLAAGMRSGGRSGKWGLIVALAALPVYYLVHDLVSGYSGFAHGHATVAHDLTYLGGNLVQGSPTARSGR